MRQSFSALIAALFLIATPAQAQQLDEFAFTVNYGASGQELERRSDFLYNAAVEGLEYQPQLGPVSEMVTARVVTFRDAMTTEEAKTYLAQFGRVANSYECLYLSIVYGEAIGAGAVCLNNWIERDGQNRRFLEVQSREFRRFKRTTMRQFAFASTDRGGWAPGTRFLVITSTTPARSR